MTYVCKICKTDSVASEFYSGVTNRCKECHKAKVRENRKNRVEYYRAYDAERFQKDPRVKARNKRYQATEAGKASMNAARKKWLANNPDKRAAHVLLGNAIKYGKVIKPKSCSICNCKPSRIHGHHADYTKPLDVVWCCSKCHEQIHKDQ